MVRFAFITEGVTDQIVIENILNGFFKTTDIDINELQPSRDETDKNRAENYGGWTLVFEYCKNQKFKEAFQFNDYIIIQIDTDVSEEKHYDIPKQDKDGKILSATQLIKKVIEKFRGEIIGVDFFDSHKDKIIFAIAVHSIECWLLPLYYNDKRKAALVNCTKKLNRKLIIEEEFTIDGNKKIRFTTRKYQKNTGNIAN